MEYYSNNCNYIQYIDSCRMSRCFVAKLSTAYEYKEVNSNSLSIVRQLACLEDATFGIDILVCNKSRRCFKIWSHIYIYIYVEGTFMYRMTGFGKIPHNTYNNCPKANFDFICRRSTLSHFHLSSEDLRTSITIHSIGKASLKSDLLTHLLFNGSSNSWVHFLWLSFKFAVIFILACLAFVHVLLESILNSN